MQALQYLAINPRHPDAHGCFFAAPFTERGGSILRDATGSRGKGKGDCLIVGTPTWDRMRSGHGVVVTQGNLYQTASGASPWTSAGGISVMFRVRPDSFPGTKVAVNCCGISIGFQAGAALWVGNDNTSTDYSIGAFTAGIEYVIGVRWTSTGTVVSSFINGAKNTSTASFPGSVAGRIGIGANTAASDQPMAIRDFRIWDRLLPDSAFERYYTQPQAFYVLSAKYPRLSSVLLRPSGAAGRFLPFLHPAF